MPNKFNWYLICTKPSFEKKVFHDLTEDGFEVFLPLTKKATTWKNRQHVITEIPLIPGYLFGKLTDSEYIEVKEHKDVSKFLTEQGQSVTIPDEEVELLRKFQKKGIEYTVEDMIIGKDYIVESGEFQGLKGVLKNGRLYLRLRGIGLGVSIGINDII